MTAATMHFAALLKRYRLAAQLSQEALAERAHLSARAVSNLERGVNRTPRADTVVLLADALALSDRQRAAFKEAASTSTPVSLSHLLSPPHNLPAPPTPLVGRTRVLAAVTSLLSNSAVRLLTLTGSGGVGKTRLAVQAAEDVLDRFEDGVFLVSLASIRDPRLVAATAIQVLHLQIPSGEDERSCLIAALRDKRLLLILDNFEHVAAAAPLLVDLLAACPRLQILVTSRAALRLRSEQEYAVPPLELPDPRRLPPLEALAQIEAVQLFLQRAQAIRPEIAWTTATAPAIVEICRRLDGQPLAIELAAAQVRLLPIPALLARLTRSLPLELEGPLDLPERQRTMRAAIAWSYDLLAPGEQGLFRRLSICVGGCTLAAAEALNARNTEPAPMPAQGTALQELTSLVQQSLLSMTEQDDGEPRFSMLETVREYGLEQLAVHAETAAAERAHAHYFQALAEQAEPELQQDQPQTWLNRLDRELDNLRAALAWARRQAENRVDASGSAEAAEIGLRLSTALRLFWEIRGHLGEGCSWIDTFLTHTAADLEPAIVRLRAKACNVAGWLSYKRADYTGAITLCTQSLELYKQIGPQDRVASVLNNLAGIVQDSGDGDGARALYEECLALNQASDDRWGVAATLNNLGTLALDQGDYAGARHWLERGIALIRAIGDPRVISITLVNMAEVARQSGAQDEALTKLRESLGLAASLHDREQLAFVLEGMARVAVSGQQMRQAARLCGAAAGLRESIEAPLPPVDQGAFAGQVAAARAALGDEAFAAAWDSGYAHPHAQTIEWAAAASLS